MSTAGALFLVLARASLPQLDMLGVFAFNAFCFRWPRSRSSDVFSPGSWSSVDLRGAG